MREATVNQCENCGEYREDLERLVLYDPWTNEREVYEHVCPMCVELLTCENQQAYHDLDISEGKT